MSAKCNPISFFLSLVCLIFTIQLFYAEFKQAWSVVPPAYLIWLLVVLAFGMGIIGFKDKRNWKTQVSSWFTVLVSLCLAVVLLLPLFQSAVVSEKPMKTIHSPNEHYSIRLYLINGGATTPLSVKGELEGPLWFTKEVYFDYQEDQAKVEWKNDHTVSLNNHVLNLKKGETYKGY